MVQISTKETGMEAQPYRAMTVEDNSVDDQMDDRPRTPSSDGLHTPLLIQSHDQMRNLE
jgi:hypothetical protein